MSLVFLLRKILEIRNQVGSTNNAALGSRTGISKILIFYPLELDCSFVFRVRLRNDRIGRFDSQLAAYARLSSLVA